MLVLVFALFDEVGELGLSVGPDLGSLLVLLLVEGWEQQLPVLCDHMCVPVHQQPPCCDPAHTTPNPQHTDRSVKFFMVLSVAVHKLLLCSCMQLDYLMDWFGAVCTHIMMPWPSFAHLVLEWEEVVWCILDEHCAG